MRLNVQYASLPSCEIRLPNDCFDVKCALMLKEGSVAALGRCVTESKIFSKC